MNSKKINQNILRTLGNYIIVPGVNLLCKSLKIEFINKQAIEGLEKEGQNFVFAFWHGTMLLPWYVKRNNNFIGLTSKSKDGNLLAKVLKNWNYMVVRGSSHQGGDVALGVMVDYARNKKSIAITPDGPRGPEKKMKAGAVVTAKKANVPLILAGVAFNKKKKLKSWDQFEIPKFFSRARIIYSDPIYVSNNLTYEETSVLIKECEIALNKLQEEAGNFK